MKLKLKDYQHLLVEGKFHENEKMQFREDISAFGRFGEHIYNGRGMKEVIEGVKNLTERASAMALDESGEEGWFEAVTVKKNMNEIKKDAALFEKTANEMGALQQRLEALYEDMAHKLGRYYEVGELAGKEVLPADNDYTANGEEEEEENNDEQYQLKHLVNDEGVTEQGHPLLPKSTHVWGYGDMMGGDMDENFSSDSGKMGLQQPGNQTNPNPNQGNTNTNNMNDLNAASNPQGDTMGLGGLMSSEEVAGVKENYWTLQGAQGALMEDDADEDTPGMADVNQATGWKARNESRADFFSRMKEQLETL